MRHGLGTVSLFTLGFLAVFVGIGAYVDELSGGGGGAEAGGKVSIDPESGERLFWGRGTCSNCHKVGSRGSASRGPDQDGLGGKLAGRVEERSKQLGRPVTPAEYLVESIVDPKAYEVAGYSPTIMPKVYETVPLNRDEILAALTYLWSLGGEPDVEALMELAGTIPQPAPGGKRNPVGDPKAGEALFMDDKGKAGCAKCHKVGEKGATTCPDLTGIGAIQGADYLLESILFPSRTIVKGYESFLIEDTDERIWNGLVKEPTPGVFEVYDSEGVKVTTLNKDEIKEKVEQKLSNMPGNFAFNPGKDGGPAEPGTVTMREILDIVAYLLSQR